MTRTTIDSLRRRRPPWRKSPTTFLSIVGGALLVFVLLLHGWIWHRASPTLEAEVSAREALQRREFMQSFSKRQQQQAAAKENNPAGKDSPPTSDASKETPADILEMLTGGQDMTDDEPPNNANEVDGGNTEAQGIVTELQTDDEAMENDMEELANTEGDLNSVERNPEANVSGETNEEKNVPPSTENILPKATNAELDSRDQYSEHGSLEQRASDSEFQNTSNTSLQYDDDDDDDAVETTDQSSSSHLQTNETIVHNEAELVIEITSSNATVFSTKESPSNETNVASNGTVVVEELQSNEATVEFFVSSNETDTEPSSSLGDIAQEVKIDDVSSNNESIVESETMNGTEYSNSINRLEEPNQDGSPMDPTTNGTKLVSHEGDNSGDADEKQDDDDDTEQASETMTVLNPSITSNGTEVEVEHASNDTITRTSDNHEAQGGKLSIEPSDVPLTNDTNLIRLGSEVIDTSEGTTTDLSTIDEEAGESSVEVRNMTVSMISSSVDVAKEIAIEQQNSGVAKEDDNDDLEPNARNVSSEQVDVSVAGKQDMGSADEQHDEVVNQIKALEQSNSDKNATGHGNETLSNENKGAASASNESYQGESSHDSRTSGGTQSVIENERTTKVIERVSLAYSIEPEVQQSGTHGPETSENVPGASEHVAATCHADPGDGEIEGGVIGIPFLQRMGQMGKTLANRQDSTPFVTCILPFLSPEVQSSILETFGTKCNSILIFSHTQVPPVDPPTTFPATVPFAVVSVDQQMAGPQSFYATFQTELLSRLKADSWIYWATSDRYFIPVFADDFLKSLPADDASWPQWIESWVLSNPNAFKNHHDLKSEDDSHASTVCGFSSWETTPRLWNTAAVEYIFAKLPKKKIDCPWSEELIPCFVQIAARRAQRFEEEIHCVAWNLPKEKRLDQHWWRIQRYSETLVSTVSGRTRLHAILEGLCDDYWNRYRGALDSNGEPGYIPDPYNIRKNPLPLRGSRRSICAPVGHGDEGHGREVIKAVQKLRLKWLRDEVPPSQQRKVLCMVYTHSEHHESHLRPIVETWASHCDGFWAASNKTDPSLNAVNLLHEGPEEFENLWLKVVAMWKFAYQNFLNDFDFFQISGDDTYVIGENLRYLVSTGGPHGAWNQSAPLYLGSPIPVSRRARYCSSGAGYTLNRPAVERLMQSIMTDLRCRPHFHQSTEDVFMAACLKGEDKLQCMDTNDANGEMRYHSSNLQFHATWDSSKKAYNWYLLPEYHGIEFKPGLGQISHRSVSFHLMYRDDWKPRSVGSAMRRYHALFYGLCEKKG